MLDEPRQLKQDWELGEVRDGPPLDAVALHLLQHHVGVILHGVLGSSRPRSTWKASPYYCRCWSRSLPCPRTPLGGARTLLQPCVASAPRHDSGRHTKLLVVHPCCLILVRDGRRCRTRRTEMQDAGSHAAPPAGRPLHLLRGATLAGSAHQRTPARDAVAAGHQADGM